MPECPGCNGDARITQLDEDERVLECTEDSCSYWEHY